MNKSLVGFEFEKSLLHTIVYVGPGTGKPYFFRQYLKLYQDQEQNNKDMMKQKQKQIIILCKDEQY